jgi:hypothetical protein
VRIAAPLIISDNGGSVGVGDDVIVRVCVWVGVDLGGRVRIAVTCEVGVITEAGTPHALNKILMSRNVAPIRWHFM